METRPFGTKAPNSERTHSGHFNYAECDYAVRWRGKGVMTITDGREEEHEEAGCKIFCNRFRFWRLRQRLAAF